MIIAGFTVTFPAADAEAAAAAAAAVDVAAVLAEAEPIALVIGGEEVSVVLDAVETEDVTTPEVDNSAARTAMQAAVAEAAPDAPQTQASAATPPPAPVAAAAPTTAASAVLAAAAALLVAAAGV